MDLLRECAQAYNKLLAYEYHFIIRRKGKSREFTLTFDKADFHHLAGLHKLKDNMRLQRGKRADIFDEILEEKIGINQIQKSSFYKEMAMRLEPLTHLEEFLDNEQLIFRYNEKVHKYSCIKAEYLLEGKYKENVIYLFLGARDDTLTHMCRTFFPKSDKNYSAGQPQFTLLKKEKLEKPY